MTAPIITGTERMTLPTVLYERHAEWSRSVAGSFGYGRDGQLWERLNEASQ
jgi:hypothetical protein